MNREIAYIIRAYKKHTLSNIALLNQFLKLGEFVWRDFLYSMIQQITGSVFYLSSRLYLSSVPVIAGKAKAGMAHSDCGWTCGCADKTVKSLENTCHTWALLRWWFNTKRRYIKCMHLYLYLFITADGTETYSPYTTFSYFSLISLCLVLYRGQLWQQST